MDVDTTDEHDRPTVPNASGYPLALGLAFDVEAERFFLAGDGAFDETETLDAPSEEEEVTDWWIEQRRCVRSRYVAAMVALCVCLLAAGVLPR